MLHAQHNQSRVNFKMANKFLISRFAGQKGIWLIMNLDGYYWKHAFKKFFFFFGSIR